MRAFVNSLLAITASLLLLGLLFAFQTFSLQTSSDAREAFNTRYAGYYFDDVGYDLRPLVNPFNMSVARHNSTSLRIEFALQNRTYGINSSLLAYGSMLPSFASRTNTNISLDYSLASSQNITMAFSNNMNFTYAQGNPDRVYILAPSPSAFSNITLSITSNYSRISLSTPNFTLAGDMYVLINYRDANGTQLVSGYMNRTQSKNLTARYYSNSTSNGTLQVTFGSIGNNNSMLYVYRQNLFPGVGAVSYASVGAGEISVKYPISIGVSYINVSKYASMEAFRG